MYSVSTKLPHSFVCWLNVCCDEVLDHHDATLLSWMVPVQYLCDIRAVMVRFLCDLAETHLALIKL